MPAARLETGEGARGAPRRPHPWMLVAGCAVPALFLSLHLAALQKPWQEWAGAVLRPDMADIDGLLLVYSFLPRLVMALLCGAALGLSGTLFQQVLRNPLAEPTTLGVSGGASLALVIANLWFPAALGAGQEAIALTGAATGCLLVFVIARRQRFSTSALIMAGLVVSLYCGSLASLAVLFHHDYLDSLFLWESGSLYQNSWDGALYLLPRLAIAWPLAMVFLRPIGALRLGDTVAGAVGVNVNASRIAIIVLAALLGGFVVSVAGMIAFIGLAAPNLARLCGARTTRRQLVWSPFVGAALLWLADGLVQVVGPPGGELPTGVATAFLGAPLLLFLVMRAGSAPEPTDAFDGGRLAGRPWAMIVATACLLLVVSAAALVVGRAAGGWDLTLPARDAHALLQWRWPRILAAASAGALLSIAGCIIQRLTGNPVASPEVLGMTSGATVGYLLQVILLSSAGQASGLAGAAAGAGVTLGLLLGMNGLSGGRSDRTLLVGVAITTVCGAVMTGLMASGHPALRGLLGWVQGSTARVGAGTALSAAAMLFVSAMLLVLLVRWLRILPLGPSLALAVGVPVRRAQILLLAFCAVVTGLAALLIGPLTFVGLMAPHIARRLGLQGPAAHLAGAGLIGAVLMVVSDWGGRVLLFPWEIPAGLVSAFIGGPYFLWLMQRTSR